MRAFRMLAGLLILACLVPAAVLALAVLIARSAGCEVDPDVPVRCAILGGDFGDILYAMAHFGWHTVETLPILAVLLITWIVTEIVRALGRPRKPARQTPASSRNRERGS